MQRILTISKSAIVCLFKVSVGSEGIRETSMLRFEERIIDRVIESLGGGEASEISNQEFCTRFEREEKETAYRTCDDAAGFGGPCPYKIRR